MTIRLQRGHSMVKQVRPDLTAQEARLVNLVVLFVIACNGKLVWCAFAKLGPQLLTLLSQAIIYCATLLICCRLCWGCSLARLRLLFLHVSIEARRLWNFLGFVLRHDLVEHFVQEVGVEGVMDSGWARRWRDLLVFLVPLWVWFLRTSSCVTWTRHNSIYWFLFDCNKLYN